MNLRTKFTLVLSTIVVGAALVVSMIIFGIAYTKLEQAAEKRLTGRATLLAELVQRRFNTELRRFKLWAAMPLVVNTALDNQNPDLLLAFDRYFSTVVDSEPYSSIYIISRERECVACDDPRRMYHPYCHDVISKKPSARAGFSGHAGFGEVKLSVATGRPVLVMTAPIRHHGRTVAILRTSIDVDCFRREVFESIGARQSERIYMFAPILPQALPKGQQLQAPTERRAYTPLPKALRTAFNTAPRSVFRYQDHDEKHMVAASRMRQFPFVFLASQTMSTILGPIMQLQNASVLATLLLLVLLVGSIYWLTEPVIQGINDCRRFADGVRNGRLDRRLHYKGRDEIGHLARDLNEMAVQLQEKRLELEDAEHKYRGIFENAVEGIFQTDRAGRIHAANPALAKLLGASSTDEVLDCNISRFYAKRQSRSDLLAILDTHNEVAGFDCEIRRQDGALRHVIINARAQRGIDGELSTIRGFVEDVTERRKAEMRAQRAREAEELLLRTELEMLRYQINPHFLLNALNSLRELILSSPADSVLMIESLAAFCHTNLVTQADKLITVADELKHAMCYLKIEKVRFGQRLRVEIEAGDHVGNLPVPAFIIQPLVENAVKYGRKSGANPLQIKIQAALDGDDCVLKVANTGQWFEPDQTQSRSNTRLGLQNVQRRLKRHFEGRAEFTTREVDGWVTIEMRLPVQNRSNIQRPQRG